MTRTLHPYQKRAIAFLIQHRFAGLFADMGLGKTASALYSLIDGPMPVLLVAPIRVIELVWRQEAALWPDLRHLRFRTIRGTPKDRLAELSGPGDIYMINPELLSWLYQQPNRPKFRVLVVDESALFKSPQSQRFKILRKHLGTFERRIILTGTPTPNSLMDLWSQIFLLDMGERLMPSFFLFKQRWFEQADYMGYVFRPRPGTNEAIADKIADIVFRIDAKDHLPPRSVVHNRLVFDLPPDAQKAYDSFKKNAFAEIQKETVTVTAAVASLMKLRQVASGFVYNEEAKALAVHTEKVELLREVKDETGSPIVVLYQFIHELTMLKKAFPEGKSFSSNLIDDWNRGEIPMLFLHPKSAGLGINLQEGGHTIVVFSSSFSHSDMTQAFARIDRQGQKHPVIIHHLLARDTVDELIEDVLVEKGQNQDSLLERIKKYATNHR